METAGLLINEFCNNLMEALPLVGLGFFMQASDFKKTSARNASANSR